MPISSKVWMIPQEPLPSFKFPNDQDNERNLDLRIPSSRTGTTARWAQEFAQDLKLAREQWDWKLEAPYARFEREVKGYDDGLSPKSISDTPFSYPRTEGDVAVAIEYQLVNPVWHIAQQWLPRPANYTLTRNFQWGLEVLNEAYSKKYAANSTNNDFSQGDFQYHVHKPSTDQPPVEASREFAVRVDKVVVLGLQGVREGRPLRARTQTEAKFSEIHAANEYLERDEIWGKLTGFKSNTANNRHNENRIEKKDHVKALVPIEIKDHGYIHEPSLRAMAKSENAIGGSDKTKKDSVPIAGTRAILQQAIRYAIHYGTDYVFLSHYNFSLLLSLDKESPMTTDVRWAVVSMTDARIALAYVLWHACNDLKDDLARFQVAETKMKDKAGKGLIG